MVQVPVVTRVSAPPDVMVQTPVVEDVNATARFDVEDAVSVGAVPKLCEPGLLKVIVCAPFGVTELEADDATLLPTEFVAVTVKVYAVPFVRPVTAIGEAVPVAVRPPGEEVTV